MSGIPPNGDRRDPRRTDRRRSPALKGHLELLARMSGHLAVTLDVQDTIQKAIELIELLQERGAKVDYNDPYIPSTHKQREHDLRMKSVPVTAASLKKYDCVIISTEHDAYDYDMIVRNAKAVVDTRNACAQIKGGKRNVFKA